MGESGGALLTLSRCSQIDTEDEAVRAIAEVRFKNDPFPALFEARSFPAR